MIRRPPISTLTDTLFPYPTRVRSVDITPVRGAALADGSVRADLDVRMKAAPMRTIAGSAGYDTGQGVRAEISWQHRNLIRPEGDVTFRAIAGTKEQLGAAELRRSNFKRRDQVLNGRVAVQRQRIDRKSITLNTSQQLASRTSSCAST